jgi:hypothetical protein
MVDGRTKWAAVGAAVAVTLGAGGISLGQAAIGTGDKPVFVAIEPCRLVDTRPGATNIGGRTAPLSASDTLTLQVTGASGQCTGIPAGATAAAMNVTAIQGSTRSYLSVYPADGSLPNASNLNWNGGDPPTPNKVDVALSSTGAVKITNNAGTVHVAADLVGYYTDHTHDDRYYTKNQIDAGIPRDESITLAGGAFTPRESQLVWAPGTGCFRPGTSDAGMRHSIPIPSGATVTSIAVRTYGTVASTTFAATLFAQRPGTSGSVTVHQETLAGFGLREATIDVPDEVVDPGESLYLGFGSVSVNVYLCAATIHYRQPG